jgi:ATP-dependent DNA ligase
VSLFLYKRGEWFIGKTVASNDVIPIPGSLHSNELQHTLRSFQPKRNLEANTRARKRDDDAETISLNPTAKPGSETGEYATERRHEDTTRKHNDMQMFFGIRAFLLKLDGYRSIAFKTSGKIHLRSRNDNDFASRYPSLAKALQAMPDETVIDGEVVALDSDGKPSFNLLQNYASTTTTLIFYGFDVMILSGKDVMAETLDIRRGLQSPSVSQRDSATSGSKYSAERSFSLTAVRNSSHVTGVDTNGRSLFARSE